MVVDHVQSLGFAGTLAVNYHNGRCQMGFARSRISPRERLRKLSWSLLAPGRVAKDTTRLVLRMLIRKRRHRREALISAPLIAVVLGAHIAGEVAGLLFGP